MGNNKISHNPSSQPIRHLETHNNYNHTKATRRLTLINQNTSAISLNKIRTSKIINKMEISPTFSVGITYLISYLTIGLGSNSEIEELIRQK